MRRVVPSVGLVALAVAMSVSACASSSSRGSAVAAGSDVAALSPAAGSASASASATEVSSPARACPAVAAWPSHSRSPGAAGQLFVESSPTQATLCHYVLYTTDGSSLPPPGLVQITGPTLTNLVGSLNALLPTKDAPACPGPAKADELVFVGAGPPSTVRVEQGGCDFAWSDSGVHAHPTNALRRQLAAIVANAPVSAPPPAGSSGTATVGDATAVAACRAAANARQAASLTAADTTPAPTVVAGFNTTDGDAHRYADSLGLRPGDPSPRPPAGSGSYYTSTTPVVACVLDGDIGAPNLPGNPPYSRELVLIGPGGVLHQLVAGRTDTIRLQNPSSATH
jgi:hypothetical protein